MPVLPLVGSMIVPPGWRWPSFSAASIIASAMRSLIDPPGFERSDFTQTSDSGNSFDRRTCGVLPIVLWGIANEIGRSRGGGGFGGWGGGGGGGGGGSDGSWGGGGFTGGEFAYQAANAVIFFIVITIVSLLQFRVLQRREADF